MAVTTTPTFLLTWAMSGSKENDPGDITSQATELLQFVVRATRGVFSLAARVNPSFFATSSSVAFSAPGWARPVTAESVFRIENPSNTEVIVVPIDQRAADPARPALYRYGQIYRSAGNAADPTSGNLTFFYSKRPTDPASINGTLDPLWEGAEQFNELLVSEIQVYLALRDNRLGELEKILQRRNYWANLFVAFLEHETANEVRSYDATRRFNTETRVPLTSLLAGGAPVNV